jgi:hypothetical protein
MGARRRTNGHLRTAASNARRRWLRKACVNAVAVAGETTAVAPGGDPLALIKPSRTTEAHCAQAGNTLVKQSSGG